MKKIQIEKKNELLENYARTVMIDSRITKRKVREYNSETNKYYTTTNIDINNININKLTLKSDKKIHDKMQS